MTCVDAFSRWMVCVGLCLLPLCASALERQNVLIQASDKPARHSGSVNAESPDRLSPERAAQEWHLTVAEWAHYRELMQGRARYFAADIPPLMVLAMYAENDQERDRYAELLAQYERDKADRLLAVQRAYDAAMKRLYPNAKIIDFDLLRQQGLLPAKTSSIPGAAPSSPDSRTPRFGDTLALFASAECNQCADKIRTLVSRYSIAPLEVYFAGDSTAFKRWIQQTKLQPDWLKQNGVTFAQDEGQSQQYQAAPGTIFIVRDRALLEMML